MARLLFFLLNLFAFVHGQGSALPATTAAPNSACGGCYVIADVAAIVFGSELLQTATQFVSVGVGRNGTQITTQFLQSGGEFSFNPSGLITGGGGGGVSPFTGTVVTISGATLTSPTAYQVFTAYSVTSIVPINGVCSTVRGPASQVSPAFSVVVPENANTDYVFEAESSFIEYLGGVTCAPGGVSISTTTQVPVAQTTIPTTVTGPIRPTPVGASTIASSTATALAETESTSAAATATSPTFSPTTTVLSTISLANNATGTIIVAGNATSLLTGIGPSATFVPFTGGAGAVFGPSTLVAAVAMLVPGVFAWAL